MSSKPRRLWLGLVLFSVLLALAGGANAQSGGDAPQVVLYSQLDFVSAKYVSSTFYSSPFYSANSNQAADDFTLQCAGSCSITNVYAQGKPIVPTFSGSTVRVEFYADSGAGLPGTLLNAQDAPLNPINTELNINVSLPTAIHLGSGHWWVSVAPNSLTNVSWIWQERTVISGAASAWQNPSGVLKPQCQTWRARVAVCQYFSATDDPDLLFSLSGIDSGSNLQPVITGFAPGHLAPNVGGPVTIYGYNFASGASVSWNGTPLATAFVNGNQLTVTAPALPFGAIPVTVTNTEPCVNVVGDGASCTSNARTFVIGLPLYLPLIRR